MPHRIAEALTEAFATDEGDLGFVDVLLSAFESEREDRLTYGQTYANRMDAMENALLAISSSLDNIAEALRNPPIEPHRSRAI